MSERSFLIKYKSRDKEFGLAPYTEAYKVQDLTVNKNDKESEIKAFLQKNMIRKLERAEIDRKNISILKVWELTEYDLEE